MELNKVYNEDARKTLKRIPDNFLGSVVTDPPYGIKFMGKSWDYDVPSVKIWQRVYRKLKPGGHMLVCCGTRTQHRMVTNIEDAGFEIRDIIVWAYGEGFPKSMNVGKEVDKLQGNERQVIGRAKGQSCDANLISISPGLKKEFDATKGNSEWEGWGTGLKPAIELWTLCRKPIEENTIAENCIKHGVGAINIDGCKIGTEDNLFGGGYSGGTPKSMFDGLGRKEKEEFIQPDGRFPANLIHDGSDEVTKLFPETSSGGSVRHNKGKLDDNIYGKYKGVESYGWADSGNASRFFYCAKASQSERNAGMRIKTEKSLRPPGVAYNEHSAVHTIKKKGNFHPTVKPIELMKYLVRLITPPNEICYDPFSGSGTTLIGCIYEDVQWIGSELNPEYIPIIEARIKEHKKLHNPKLF